MKLDRDLQKRILNACAAHYPRALPMEEWDADFDALEEQLLAANLVYLHQHGLLKEAVRIGMGGDILFNVSGMCCTEAGMDFIADDGGLSAILGTVTIKIHEDTLRELLERKILESDTAPEEKSRLVQGLKGLSAEAIKHLTLKLLDEGLERLPGAVALVGKFLP